MQNNDLSLHTELHRLNLKLASLDFKRRGERLIDDLLSQKVSK